MNFTIDHIHPQEGINTAIEETIKAFLKDVSVKLAPLRVQLDHLDFADFYHQRLTEHVLKSFAEEVWGCIDPSIELTMVMPTNLIAVGENEVSTFVEFLISLKLTEQTDLEVEVCPPVGVIVLNHEVAAVYAHKISNKLIDDNTTLAIGTPGEGA